MRTTIELDDELRAALLSLAAKRGMRGYSSLVQEALAQYLGISLTQAPKPHPVSAKKDAFLSFLEDGFTTGRRDGSAAHDDYIYRKR